MARKERAGGRQSRPPRHDLEALFTGSRALIGEIWIPAKYPESREALAKFRQTPVYHPEPSEESPISGYPSPLRFAQGDKVFIPYFPDVKRQAGSNQRSDFEQ